MGRTSTPDDHLEQLIPSSDPKASISPWPTCPIGNVESPCTSTRPSAVKKVRGDRCTLMASPHWLLAMVWLQQRITAP